MQAINYITESGLQKLHLPDPEENVVAEVKWGRHDELFTPAYWACQSWIAEASHSRVHYKLGTTLNEEIGACLLGGYGIPAEVGLAAFARLRDRGQLDGAASARELFQSLSEPLVLGDRVVKYRFARQKSLYLEEVLRLVRNEHPPDDDLSFRAWLLKFRGIGPKTASWITRNWKDSDAVAIIDVHICRAGLLVGLFRSERPQSHYFEMERSFLSFATAIGVRTSILDTIIWSQMRRWGTLASLD